jgi:hydroxyisourate hydrolase
LAKLSTHVLDTHGGTPAKGVRLRLYERRDGQLILVKEAVTNTDGRTDEPLLSGEAIPTGRYRMVFDMASYFQDRGVALSDPPFLEDVALEFGLAEAHGSYHVPLVCTPWSYSTYRGS